jgi:hypothetical protein
VAWQAVQRVMAHWLCRSLVSLASHVFLQDAQRTMDWQVM